VSSQKKVPKHAKNSTKERRAYTLFFVRILDLLSEGENPDLW